MVSSLGFRFCVLGYVIDTRMVVSIVFSVLPPKYLSIARICLATWGQHTSAQHLTCWMQGYVKLFRDTGGYVGSSRVM